MSDADKLFAGSIPKLYETHLVPLIFGPYAADIVQRLQDRPPARLLEIAAGTGVVTRALSSALGPGTSIVATDLNQAMLDQAVAVGTAHPVEWRQADAQQLPFPDAGFDAIVCQFGVMFFPDKRKAFSEARRVLKPGGVFIFNVWDRLAENEFADSIHATMQRLFPSDPPRFLARTPYGYHDPAVIAKALSEAGFDQPAQFATVPARSRADSARSPAIAYCQGTPLRAEIEARDASGLAEATRVATQAVATRFGSGAVEAKIQALVVTVGR